MSRGLAVVTGASTGIGFELARCCAADKFDLVVCADEPEIEAAAARLRDGVAVTAVRADLGTEAGVNALMAATSECEIDLLLANAGMGLRGAFLDQDWPEARRVIEIDVIGTLALLHRAGRRMRARGSGRILITGSIAGYMPGSFHGVYNGSKAFLDNFAYAIHDELKDSGVTVTCLMPGVTDTEFFRRAGLEDTQIGASEDKADPADVAAKGYDAMMRGEPGIVTGLGNKLTVAAAGLIPEPVKARFHRQGAEPDGGR